jgi:hypothetical protein
MFDAGVMHPTAKTTYASVELRNQAVTVNACVPHLDDCAGPRSSICDDCALSQRLRSLYDLFGPRPHPVVLREIHPADSPRRIQQEFGWPGDVLSIDPSTPMQEIIAANDLGFRIREKSVRIACLLTQVARSFRRVHADRYRSDSQLFNLCQAFLDTP